MDSLGCVLSHCPQCEGAVDIGRAELTSGHLASPRADIVKAELEEKQFKVKLTVIDTPGFGDYVNNRESWIPIVDFIVSSVFASAVLESFPPLTSCFLRASPQQDDQHESFMRQEQQPQRISKLDLRVHACLYFIRPTGHGLKPLDIEVMKRLGSRVNLIPIVAKADTLTPSDLAAFKQRVRPADCRLGRARRSERRG